MSYMIEQFKAGTKVKVIEFGGKSLTRIAVSDKGKSVIVCTEREYMEATMENRHPVGVGFPRGSVEMAKH